MKYLHDNNFRVIRVSDLGYNQTTNSLYIKGLQVNIGLCFDTNRLFGNIST
jgi:hypothetical protein